MSKSIFYGILTIYWNSSSQTFQKKQRGTNIWEGRNILRSSTYIQVLQNTLKCGILEINPFYLSSTSEILEKEVGELLSEGELIFYYHSDISFLQTFLVNEALSFT